MKTVLEYKLKEEEMMNLGMDKNVLIFINISDQNKIKRELIVFPNEECREKDHAFELHALGEKPLYVNWKTLQSMQVHSIYQKVVDNSNALKALLEDYELMNDLSENTPEDYIGIEYNLSTERFSAAKYTFNPIGNRKGFKISKSGILSYEMQDDAIKAAISWGKSEGLEVIVQNVSLYKPEKK